MKVTESNLDKARQLGKVYNATVSIVIKRCRQEGNAWATYDDLLLLLPHMRGNGHYGHLKTVLNLLVEQGVLQKVADRYRVQE